MKSKELKNIREKLGLTQKDFASLLGFSREKYSQLELGKKAIDYADELLVKSKAQDAYNTHSDSVSTVNEPSAGYKFNQKQLGQAADSIAIMTNTSTSLVSLDLLCEVLSYVSGQPLADIKVRASAMLEDRGQKLQHVLRSVF